MDFSKRTPGYVQELSPYQVSKRKAGEVWLNANEFAMPTVYEISHGNLNRYPEAQPRGVIAQYAAYADVTENQVVVTRGGDEGIEVMIRTFCETGRDRIVVFEPTYLMYEISAQTCGVAVEHVPMTDKDAWLESLRGDPKHLAQVGVIFVCNPNNPTAEFFEDEWLEKLLSSTVDRVMVVVDEAYIEFCPHKSKATWLERYPHLVILRTLSKAFALAGLRCGFLLMNSGAREEVLKVLAPYAVPAPVADIAQRALCEAGLSAMRKRVSEVARLREDLCAKLNTLSIVKQVFASNTNFILVAFNDADRVYKVLLEEGFWVRDQRMLMSLGDCLRITVGSELECEGLIRILEKLDRGED